MTNLMRSSGCSSHSSLFALDHGGDLIVVNRPRPAWTGLIKKTFHAVLQETAPPLAHGVFVDTELGRNRFARDALGAP